MAFVVAEDRYSARDALELIDVDYEILQAVVDVRTALDPSAPVIRDDLEGKEDNLCFEWETGDAAATEEVFASADVVVSEDLVYPRVHPAPMETCGAVADFDPVDGKLVLWSTSQAPHAHRTLYAIVAGLPEHKIRVVWQGCAVTPETLVGKGFVFVDPPPVRPFSARTSTGVVPSRLAGPP